MRKQAVYTPWPLEGYRGTSVRVVHYANQGLESPPWCLEPPPRGLKRGFFIDNLLVRIHLTIEMIWWTGFALWEFEFPFPGSLTCTFL
jgi:hypothetical protein